MKEDTIVCTKCKDVLLNPPEGMQNCHFTAPPQCMPDEYKCDDYIESYRTYYTHDKKRFAKYTHREMPDFMKEKQKETDE